MSWDYDESLERIRQHLDSMGEIEVEKLGREADLGNLLSRPSAGRSTGRTSTWG